MEELVKPLDEYYKEIIEVTRSYIIYLEIAGDIEQKTAKAIIEFLDGKNTEQ